MTDSSLYSYATYSISNDSFFHILLRLASNFLLNILFGFCCLTLFQVAGM